MKQRLDTILVNKSLVESKEQAQRLIMAGAVFVNGQNNIKCGEKIDIYSQIEITQREKYVSRGGLKLEAAISAFAISVTDKICVDIGTSTGGFTDCLLQAGAAHVYAIDVGKSQIHERLKADKRVTLMDNTNARYLTQHSLQVCPDIIVIDVSFISLTKIFEGLIKIASSYTVIIALIKPQFEALREEVRKTKGVITNPQIHYRILVNVLTAANEFGLIPQKVISCSVSGVHGNHEWFALLSLNDFKRSCNDIEKMCLGACHDRWSDFSLNGK